MDSEDLSQAELWVFQAFQHTEKGDYERARVCAEQAYNLDKENIDIGLIYWSTLNVKIENPSIHQLEMNIKKGREVFYKLAEKKNSGENVFSQKQKDKFIELARDFNDLENYKQNMEFKNKYL